MKVYYARYEASTPTDDKWYLSWSREWESGWSVDRTYLLSSIATLTPDARFWELPWSACQRNGLREVEAMTVMNEIHTMRLNHGYTLTESGCAIYDDEGHHTTTEIWTPDLEDTDE